VGEALEPSGDDAWAARYTALPIPVIQPLWLLTIALGAFGATGVIAKMEVRRRYRRPPAVPLRCSRGYEALTALVPDLAVRCCDGCGQAAGVRQAGRLAALYTGWPCRDCYRSHRRGMTEREGYAA
jgi:hypothetical protein